MPSIPGSGTAVPPEVDDVVELVEVPPDVVVVPPEVVVVPPEVVVPPDVDDVVVVPPEVVDEVVVPPEVDEVVVPPEVDEVDDEEVEPPHMAAPAGWPQLQKCASAGVGATVNAPAKTVAAAAIVAKRFMELPL